MRSLSSVFKALRFFVLAALLTAGIAMAAQEPTMGQIYAAAQAGNVDQAQVMVQQVLISHPNSAKAHYVQSELFARQGNVSKAQEALSTAERLAPGLPFAKPEAVQALRNQLATRAPDAPRQHTAVSTSHSEAAAPASNAWLLPALLSGGVIVGAYFIFRRKTPQAIEPNPYSGGLNGQQTFGNPVMQPAYGPQGYGQPAYGQPAGSGLGGKIMGGVATGLAVGAGVMAAEAIGRSIMGNHESAPHTADSFGSNNFEPLSGNADMGGQDFGINDTNWDDAGSSDSGSSDWDN